jgi:hypothetical protein
MVQEALRHASPVEVGDGVAVLEVTDCEVHLEGLTRSRSIVQAAIESVLECGSVRVEYRPQNNSPAVAADAPQRLNRERDQEEQLRRYRDRDPALDAIANALDLEVIE